MWYELREQRMIQPNKDMQKETTAVKITYSIGCHSYKSTPNKRSLIISPQKNKKTKTNKQTKKNNQYF